MRLPILLLLALAVPPLIGLVVFAVYRVATAKHAGFWFFTVAWSVAIVIDIVLATGLIAANTTGRFADKPVHFWGEMFAAFTLVGGGGLFALTILRLILLRLFSGTADRDQTESSPVAPLARPRPSGLAPGFWITCLGWLLFTLAVLVTGCVWFPRPGINVVGRRDEAFGFLAFVGVLLALLTAVRFTWINRRRWAAAVTYAHPVTGRNEAVSPRLEPNAPRLREPRVSVSEPSAIGHIVRVVGWTAAVLGFFLAWLWCVSRYPIWTAEDGILVIGVGVGLFILAVCADVVRAIVRRRVPGEPRQWYSLSPASSTFVGRLLIGGALFGLCVLGTIQICNVTGMDLNDLNQPPPERYRPTLPFIGFGVVFVAIGIGVAANRRRMRQSKPQANPAMHSNRPSGVLFGLLILMGLPIAIGIAASQEEGLVSERGLAFGFIAFVAWTAIAFALSLLVRVVRIILSHPIQSESHPPPVAPLILTPDPTPVGGNCPTCGGVIPAGSPHGLCPRCLLRGVMPSINATRARSTRPIEPPPAAEVGEFFPHLDVLELIGAGGMGAVYKARQPNLDRVVALKIVQSPAGDDDPIFAERFAREARAMAKLDHPNIVTIHESGEAGGLPYLLMEFVDGITLRDAMENKVLTTSEALAVIPQICDALDYAHRNGVVHRDIKPENILIDQTGRVKIADFGLAKLADPKNVTLTRTQQAMGTPHYMAPEQWEKPNEVDHRADIYALGVVLYELLTGGLPLGRFDLPSAMGKGDTRMDQVVLRALAKEPGQRYQHASDLKNELSRIDAANWLERTPMNRRGYEYRSKRTFLGWPLVHVVSGRDPSTGKHRTAKGWIAIGDVGAFGVVSVGGVYSVGVASVGGVISVGGVLAIGGAVAAGGLLAVGGAVAVGGLLALGGAMAIGQFAIGGSAVGQYRIDGNGITPGFWKALW